MSESRYGALFCFVLGTLKNDSLPELRGKQRVPVCFPFGFPSKSQFTEVPSTKHARPWAFGGSFRFFLKAAGVRSKSQKRSVVLVRPKTAGTKNNPSLRSDVAIPWVWFGPRETRKNKNPAEEVQGLQLQSGFLTSDHDTFRRARPQGWAGWIQPRSAFQKIRQESGALTA